VSVPCKCTPVEIIRLLKGITSRRLKKGFESLHRQCRRKHAALRTDGYYVGTARRVSAETVERLSWRLHDQTVSIWAANGRLPILIVRVERQGESSPGLSKRLFLLPAACAADEPQPEDAERAAGTDPGVTVIGAESDGQVHAAGHINTMRHRRLRARLQASGTPSAKCKLKRLSRKERRCAAETNQHCLSQTLPARPRNTPRALSPEDWPDMRTLVTVRRAPRASGHSRASFQLRSSVTIQVLLSDLPVRWPA